MARKREIMQQAKALGLRHGEGTAQWYFDRTEPTMEDARKVLNGIRDCDPEIMDTFVGGSLSGEFADDLTPHILMRDLDMTERQMELYGDEVCTEFEQAFDAAYSVSVEAQCMELLRRNITFHIEVELIEQDEHKLLSDLEEVLAKANTTLLESNVSEEGELLD